MADMGSRDHGEERKDHDQEVEEIFLGGVDQIVSDRGDGDLDGAEDENIRDQRRVEHVLQGIAADDGVDAEPGEPTEEIQE